MATTQYIGARYVPVFADPAEWNNTRAYEPLTIVLHEGNSFTSRQYVPTGIDISNNSYWLCTGNYNAQVEAYRAEVESYKKGVDSISNSIQGYANVEAMKSTTSPVGSIVSTAGFYNAGDTGGANYLITTSVGNTANGMDIIQLNDTSKVAVLLPDAELAVTQVGCSATLEDNSDYFNRAFELSKAVVIPSFHFFIAKPVYINQADFTLRGLGGHFIAPTNDFPADSYMLNVTATNSHFDISNIYFYGRDLYGLRVKGLFVYCPYDCCTIDQVFGSDFGNTFLTVGTKDMERVGQTLVISNCQVYGPHKFKLKVPLFELNHQQELIMRDCKTLVRSGGMSEVPVLQMYQTNNCVIEGNSFCGVETGSVISVEGASSYNNRFIANYFENNPCEYAASVDLTGIGTRSLTVFAFNTYYYNSTHKYKVNNAVNVLFIGEDEIPDSTNTRVFIQSMYSSKAFTDPSGIAFMLNDGESTAMKQITIGDPTIKPYKIWSSVSEEHDYGLRIDDSTGNRLLYMKGAVSIPTGFEVTQNSGYLSLKDANGKAHKITVNTDGTLHVS